MTLPIDTVLPELRAALARHTGAVLVAPPGAGKTTRVPPALLDAPWLGGRRILMLEPRRLAARTAAQFMARQLGEAVGATVGYRVRMDTRISASTRIEVITEGVLTRMLQADPALEEAGLVIFDEFHERSLQADLGLALALQSQAVLREDLRLLVMSATLEAEPVAALLGGAPIVVSEGRSYPVETIYAERRASGPIEPAVARVIAAALGRHDGDILAFLPGAGEIRRVEARLRELGVGRGSGAGAAVGSGGGVRIAPLYGMLPQAAQDAAIAPGAAGERKVVLATSIAETSLTVEGVRVVVDSGLMRVPRFSPRTGMSRLETTAVSRASADQRRGRAGRVAAGVCYRLWTEEEHRQLPSRRTPEVLEADLAPLALELAAWGVSDPAELAWLDAPPAAAFAQARELLARLGALDVGGAVTPHGRRMAGLGLHPRLAHMVLRALELRLGSLACELAALLGERDAFRSAPTGAAAGAIGGAAFAAGFDADVRRRVDALQQLGGRSAETGGSEAIGGLRFDPAAVRQVWAEAARLKRELGLPAGPAPGSASCGLLLALAFPDRIGQRRGDGRYLLSSGRGAAFAGSAGQPLTAAPYLVAAELDDQGADSRLMLAAALTEAELEQALAERVEREPVVVWDREAQAVRARRRERYGALVLREDIWPRPPAEAVQAALLQGVADEGLSILPWTKASRQLLQRMRFMQRHLTDWPDVSDEALLRSLADWLGPHVHGLRSRSELQGADLFGALEALLTWEGRRELDAEAPTHVTVPSGSRIPIDYADPDAPVLAVRLQEMFGLTDTPRIARGRVALTLHLLSPAHRPVQVTRDLASFWRTAYFEVKKDLKGRYPKHYWPDDPLQAIPTRRTRPKEAT